MVLHTIDLTQANACWSSMYLCYTPDSRVPNIASLHKGNIPSTLECTEPCKSNKIVRILLKIMSDISCTNNEIQTQELSEDSVKKANDNNMTVIHQFLLEHNLQDTAQHLIEEASKLGYTNLRNDTNSNHIRHTTGSYEKLLFIFKSGNCPEFFKMWNCVIPENMRRCKEYKILTLNLHVHFAILPRRRMLLLYQNKNRNSTSTTAFTPDSDSNEIENFASEVDKDTREGMMQLHEYLITDGKELEHEIQLRPFFALPHIEDPLADPFLSKTFNNDWLNELTTKLEMFISTCKENLKLVNDARNDHEKSFREGSLNKETRSADMEVSHNIAPKNNIPIVPNDRNIPMFMEDNDIGEPIIRPHKKKLNMQSKYTQTCCLQTDSFETVAVNKRLIQYNQELALAKSHFNTVECNYKKLNARFHKLHTDYHKLISVAGELTAALDNSFRGEPVDLQKTLEACIKIFPELFSRNIRDDSQLTPMTQLGSTEMINRVQSTMDVISASAHMLDFKKIKLHLMNGSVKTKLYLLQALRWKLTLTQPIERDEVIHEYITSDLLGLHGQIASDNGKSILPYLLIPGNVLIPHPLQQSTVRLLNALASIRCGRDYLSAGPIVVNVIFKCLNTSCDNGIDAFTWDMMIATLQKLSLRKQQRMYMIDTGMVEWLVYHLHSENRRMSFYRLEYATALLMNLSLHQEARIRASAIASIVISAVLGLLSVDNMPALSYVNGALNNFLSNRVINNEAKKMKLSSVLEYYQKQKTGEIRKHLDHILKIHNGECTNNTEGDETADDDNEDLDVMESQLEEDDPVKNHTGELVGDTLLATCYTILPNTSQVEDTTEDVSSSECKIKNIYEYGRLMRDLSDFNEEWKDKDPVDEMIPESPHQSDCIVQHPRVIKEMSFTHIFYPFPDEFSSVNETESIIVKAAEPAIASNDTSRQLSFKTNKAESNKQYVSNRKAQNKKPDETVSKSLKSHSIKHTNYSEAAVYLYTNDSSKESSNMTIASSFLTLTAASDIGPSATEVERFSSIASLNLDDDNKSTSTVVVKRDTELDKEGEEAFLAKPKISRTPP